MNLKQAKAIGCQWVEENASSRPGFQGAFLHGSANWLDDNATLAPSSDLDIMVVFDKPPPIKLGKIIHDGLLLEISYISTAELQSAELVLGLSHLAGSFHKPSIIADPSGQMTKLQQTIAAGYAKREWVVKRCHHVQAKIIRNLQRLQESALYHKNVTNWLFSTSLTTHILLVAGLENPTVRKRYVASKVLLEKHGQAQFQESLLELLGCDQTTPAQVQMHLDALTLIFDTTTQVIRTPIFFATDLSQVARPIAIDGSQDLIDRGLHREAIFWIVATYARCLHVLHVDGSEEMQEKYAPGFHNLLADLGICSVADMVTRAENVKEMLDNITAVAEMIMNTTSEIHD